MEQFVPVTATDVSSDATTDHEREVSAVVEVNDETGTFEYTLYPLTAPPYIRLYVPGTRRRLTLIDNHHHGPFSGTTQMSWCQKRTSGLYDARED